MLNAMIVGQVIQRCREEKGLSQEVVSGLAGIGRTHLSAIERGTRKPTLETLGVRPCVLMQAIEEAVYSRTDT